MAIVKLFNSIASQELVLLHNEMIYGWLEKVQKTQNKYTKIWNVYFICNFLIFFIVKIKFMVRNIARFSQKTKDN